MIYYETAETAVTQTITVKDAPPVGTWSRRAINPHRVVIRFHRLVNPHGEFTTSTSISVHGNAYKKDGTVGKSPDTASYYYPHQPPPEWVQTIVDEYNPWEAL